MGWSPYYPAGVTDEMIDAYFGDDGSCCEKCEHYRNGTCCLKETELDDMNDAEYEAMTEAEKEAFAKVDKDDYCDNFEWPEEEEDW